MRRGIKAGDLDAQAQVDIVLGVPRLRVESMPRACSWLSTCGSITEPTSHA